MTVFVADDRFKPTVIINYNKIYVVCEKEVRERRKELKKEQRETEGCLRRKKKRNENTKSILMICVGTKLEYKFQSGSTHNNQFFFFRLSIDAGERINSYANGSALVVPGSHATAFNILSS